jgi:hypothetical protein
MSTKLWKKIDSSTYFKDIEIPEKFESLEDFVDWYLEMRMPLMVPWDGNVVVTDNASAIPIFRYPPYQVELYINFPNSEIGIHAHPKMEVIQMLLGGGETSARDFCNVGKEWGSIQEKLQFPSVHRGDRTTGGTALLAFEKWEEGTEITSAAIQWKGITAGPIHEELIRKNKPGALVKEGFANVSKIKVQN